MVTTTTLTAEQWEIRERTLARIDRQKMAACEGFLRELADGARAEDVAAVAEDLCPGSGKDWLR